MKPLNLSSVTAATPGDYPIVEPGGYFCKIVNVEDRPDKEYLIVDLDIASGDLKDYYKDLCARANFWGCSMYWSYKENNLPYFKGSITAVEDSNPGFRFDERNEQALRGKYVGAVFAEEEYYSNKDQKIKVNVKPRFLCSVDRIKEGDYTVPKRKLYDPSKDKKRNRMAGSAVGNPLTDLMQDTDELDRWAESQKLPWED